jgi:hypothetical protein
MARCYIQMQKLIQLFLHRGTQIPMYIIDALGDEINVRKEYKYKGDV